MLTLFLQQNRGQCNILVESNYFKAGSKAMNASYHMRSSHIVRSKCYGDI